MTTITTINLFDTAAKLAGALALIEGTPFEESDALTAAVRLLRCARADIEQVVE
jgi:hypothetical protein